MTYYTLVQHSGYVTGDDFTFSRAVETHSIGRREAVAAIKAGGLVFDDYDAASRSEYEANYSNPSYTGLVPCVRGTFAQVRGVSHLARLYIPSNEDRESLTGFISEVAA